MSGLADTILKLRARGGTGSQAWSSNRLEPLGAFGSNPGSLGAKMFAPADLSARAPLVVVLHGCTQTPEGFDNGSGWSALAAQRGFALLYPAQQRANNPTLCFNWFEPGDIRRDTGEAGSICQMIATMVETYDLDPDRIFITGLSAGGAMTAAMTAAYPELFAGAAIIAGLPAGRASSVGEALHQMRHPTQSSFQKIVADSGSLGTPPVVSVWHGSNDHTVSPANGDAIVEQWRVAFDIQSPPTHEVGNGYERTAWKNSAGREVIEQYVISGMGHGVPLATEGPDGIGVAGAYMLDVGISSTHHIARFWGLAPAQQQAAIIAPSARPPSSASSFSGVAAPAGPQEVIERALRTAGLMR